MACNLLGTYISVSKSKDNICPTVLFYLLIFHIFSQKMAITKRKTHMIFQSVHQLFQLVLSILQTCFHFLNQLLFRCFAELAAGVDYLTDVFLLQHTTQNIALHIITEPVFTHVFYISVFRRVP